MGAAVTLREFHRHPYPVLIYCSINAREFHEVVKSRKMRVQRPQQNAVVLLDPGVMVVSLRTDIKRELPHLLAGILAHESMHVWQRTCAHMSEKQCGDEQEAYMLQALVEWMWQIVVDGAVN